MPKHNHNHNQRRRRHQYHDRRRRRRRRHKNKDGIKKTQGGEFRRINTKRMHTGRGMTKKGFADIGKRCAAHDLERGEDLSKLAAYRRKRKSWSHQ